MNRQAFALSVLAASLLAGCANLPEPDFLAAARPNPDHPDWPVARPEVKDLVRQIECEMRYAPNLDKLLDYKGLPDKKPVEQKVINYALVSLTLKVEDNGGLSPSLSFINPLTTGGSFTFGLNGNANLARQRIFNTSFLIDLQILKDDKPFDKNKDKYCRPDATFPALSLSGDLGIDGIMAAAVAARQSDDGNVPPKNIVPAYYVAADPSKNAAPVPTFGTTVQFTLTATFDAGPTWALTDIKGPSGSKGILNGGMTDTDTMAIAFSTAITLTPSKDPTLEKRIATLEDKIAKLETKNHGPEALLVSPDADKAEVLRTELELLQARRDTVPASEATARQAASDAARTLTTNMILQNLTGVLH